MTDTGHHNCRDYSFGPHFAPTTLSGSHPHRPIYQRHESYAELEHRTRSPASFRPKFPLFRLPLELRQQILSYVLPTTLQLGSSYASPLATHAVNFSAMQKRGAKGMLLPSVNQPGNANGAASNNVVWQRGCISILGACRQLHDECADLMYGNSTFLLFVTFSGVSFRFRWLLSTGMAPMRNYDFLELMPKRYLRLVKRCVINVDHVDSYTGMIKYNVSGKGLAYGLRKQTQRLVDALHGLASTASAPGDFARRDCPLNSIHVRASKVDDMPRYRKSSKQKDGTSGKSGPSESDGMEDMLEPFEQLCGVREVHVSGAIGDDYARKLEEQMKSDAVSVKGMERAGDDNFWVASKQPVQLCVYGNDI